MNPNFKRQSGFIRCEFTLTHSHFRLIQKCAQEKGLDERDYSAALCLILREWKIWKDQQQLPVKTTVPGVKA